MSATPPRPRQPRLPQHANVHFTKKYTPYPLVSMATDRRAVGIWGSRRQAKSLEWEAYRSVTSASPEKQHIILYYCTLSSLFAFIHTSTHTHILHVVSYTVAQAQTGLQHQTFVCKTCVIFLLKHDHELPPRPTTLPLFLSCRGWLLLLLLLVAEADLSLGAVKDYSSTHHVTLIPPCLLLLRSANQDRGWAVHVCVCMLACAYFACVWVAFFCVSIHAGRHVCQECLSQAYMLQLMD